MEMTKRWRSRHVADGIFNLKKRTGPGLCMVSGCRNEGQSKKLGLCHKHWQHRWRMLNRKPSAFATLRDHAKGRGIAFTISYDYFLGLTDALGYWSGEGVPTIDRIKPERGYEPGNITVISLSENVAKGNRERHLPAAVQAILERKRARMSGDSGNPYARDEERNPF